MLGIYDAGKSTLIHSFMQRSRAPQSTMGAAYFVYTHNEHTLHIWDTAGQERYASLLPMYTRKADILIFTVDPTNIDSIPYLKRTIPPTLASRSRNPPYALHIVVTKSDTQRDAIQPNLLIQNATKYIRKALAEAAMPNVPIRSFITSARTKKNIEAPFTTGIEAIHENESLEQIIDPLLDPILPEPTPSPARHTLSRCCPM